MAQVETTGRSGRLTLYTGIGLALGVGLGLCKHLVDLHGGTIEARQNPHGTGASFRIRFPTPAPA